MELTQPIVEGRLLRRYKRFLADVELEDGETLTVHCPNPGRMTGCAEPGRRVLLRDSQNPRRKLRYTWQAISIGGRWVNVDTQLANHAVAEALAEERIEALRGYAHCRPEVRAGEKSRMDFLLEDPARGRAWVEVKTTTWVEGGTALFPDAPTERGRRHLRELTHLVRGGDRAIQLYLVSRADAGRVAPAEAIDPAYAVELRRAAAAGVEVLAFSSRVTRHTFELTTPLDVVLAGSVTSSGS